MKFDFKIENLGYLPRWIVLFVDVMMVFLAGFITYSSFKGLNLDYINSDYFFVFVFLYLAVNVFFFWVFRSYSGIIRHSSYEDAIRLFYSQLFSFIFLVIVNYSLEIFIKEKYYLTTGLFINSFLSFCFLFLYRIGIKQVYDYYFHRKDFDTDYNVLIFGFDNNAIALANALKSEFPKRFRVVGFIDKTDQNVTKRILGLPIFHYKNNIAVLLRVMNAGGVIIVDKSLSKEERSQIVDECLEHNLKVYNIPLVVDLEGKDGITKKIKNFEILDILERKPIILDFKPISDQLKGKKIMVTGAAGSIGSEIVRQVLSFEPKKIIVVDQAETPLHNLSLEIANLNPNVKIINVISDVRVRESIEKIFAKYKPQVVYHAAAYKHVPLMEENPAQAVITNVLGTKNIADLSNEYGVERFVMISTDKAVNPSNVMGASKRIAEKYVQSLDFKLKSENKESATKFITTRFGNVLGSNGSVVPLFTKQIQEGGPVTITHPEIIRYFMTIPEACQLVLEAGSMGNGGEIFIFDMGEPVKIIDLAKKMIRLAGFVPDKDIKIKIVGLRPGEKLYEELLNDASNNLPTHHEKIMISQESDHDFDKVSRSVNLLVAITKSKTDVAIVSKMKKIVPEYKSMNSGFMELDC